MGNSIVAGLSNQQTEKQAERKGNEVFEKAKAAGMTDTQASKVATDEMLSMLPPDKRRQLLIDNDGERLSINFAGKNGKVDRNQGGLSMSMGGDDFRSRHASLVDFISDEGLWGNNQMLGLATGLLDKRAAYYSYDSVAKRGQQVFESATANSQAKYNHINRDRITQQQNLRDTSSKLNKLNEVASLKYETTDPVKMVFSPYVKPNNDPAFNARMHNVLAEGHMGVGNVGTYEEFVWLARNNTESKPIRVDGRLLADRLNVLTGPFINPFSDSGWDGLKIHGHVGINKENGHIYYGYYDFDIQKYNTSKPQSIPMTFIRNYLNEAAIYQHGKGIHSFQIQYEYTDSDIIHGRRAGK